jgi:hypothetical protein
MRPEETKMGRKRLQFLWKWHFGNPDVTTLRRGRGERRCPERLTEETRKTTEREREREREKE